jgi:hypothetical protein
MVQHVESEEFEEDGISRGETGLRAVKTLLFLLIYQLVEAVLTALIAFSLIVAFIAKAPPSARVRRFSNRVLAYGYRMGRYATYNEERAPFPFDDFPEEIEP